MNPALDLPWSTSPPPPESLSCSLCTAPVAVLMMSFGCHQHWACSACTLRWWKKGTCPECRATGPPHPVSVFQRDELEACLRAQTAAGATTAVGSYRRLVTKAEVEWARTTGTAACPTARLIPGSLLAFPDDHELGPAPIPPSANPAQGSSIYHLVDNAAAQSGLPPTYFHGILEGFLGVPRSNPSQPADILWPLPKLRGAGAVYRPGVSGFAINQRYDTFIRGPWKVVARAHASREASGTVAGGRTREALGTRGDAIPVDSD